MKKILLFLLLLSISFNKIFSQVLLNADGPGDTYELINSVLAPGYNVIEVPDCNHEVFGRHIDEVYDNELGMYVFRFYIHTTPDNDRCINFDRQRNEIKTYDKSPDNLKGVIGETFIYKWKFKLPTGFQSSSNFTHIHQLKSVGGDLDAMPMYTLTIHKGSPDKLKLRYAETDTQITLKETDLTPFKGVWIEATEKVTYGVEGTYEIELKRVSDGATMFSYTNNSIINWREEADFVRPKWGIYRSLLNSADLRDETLLFANFSIEELESSLSIKEVEFLKNNVSIYPNPSNQKVFFVNNSSNTINTVEIYNYLGSLVQTIKLDNSNTIDVSLLKTGSYVLVFKEEQASVGIQKLVVY
jgi:hypothetical protein